MALIGGQINTSNYPQPDYSGVVNAGQMQAQGLANIGAGIGKVIDNFSQVKKEQKKVDAYNKASAKSIEAAITLGKSYQIKGVEETLSPFLKSYNDPNLSPIEKAALLDEGKAMIPNVFGRFDKSQAMLIEQAQNAPAPAAPFAFTGSELKKTDKGGLYVLKGNDGLDYDPKTKLPIFDLTAYGEGLPPEVFSAGAIPAVNPIDGALNMFPNFDGTPGSMPPVDTPNPLLPPITPEGEAAMNSILAAGQLAPPVGEPPASIARPQSAPHEASAVEEGTVMTQAELDDLVKRGESVESQPLGGGKYFVKTSRLSNKLSVAELRLKYLEEAAIAYAAGDKPRALRLATAAGIGGLYGNLTISDLDDYFGSGAAPAVSNPASSAPATPTTVAPVAEKIKEPLESIIPIKK